MPIPLRHELIPMQVPDNVPDNESPGIFLCGFFASQGLDAILFVHQNMLLLWNRFPLPDDSAGPLVPGRNFVLSIFLICLFSFNNHYNDGCSEKTRGSR